MRAFWIHACLLSLAGTLLTSCTDHAALEKARQLEEQNKTLQAGLEDGLKQRQALEKTLAELLDRLKRATNAAEASEQLRRTLASQLEEEKKQHESAKKTLARLQEQAEQAARQAAERAAKVASEQAARLEIRKKAAARWNSVLDEIVAKLEQVRNEVQNFSVARQKSDLVAEEARLKGLARDQEALVRPMVLELKTLKHPKAETLERLVGDFLSDYKLLVSYRRMAKQSVLTLGQASDEIQKNEAQFQRDCYARLGAIRALKQVP